ncbi:hypothetical protein SAMN05216359_102148 [Roseateles sp. YR242]|uniref:hypothetical protein n=1 Tax=Roseateles sp. YR242 TaxID=1855305 RepID=UPI0008AA9D61|nr:hypothetical protein [Roseateles sp. YR242]SEK54304.1 hypothetical protein SAMN05216359_102148 [Roseateles sp. YR242]
MGYEAQALCELGLQREHVKALLESHEILLRGAIRRRFVLTSILNPRVKDDVLAFESADGDTVTLHLGSDVSEKWLRKIQTLPPSLAEKLGIGPDRPAAVFGTVPDEALAQALSNGTETRNLQAATVLIAVVKTPADLAAAVQMHSTMPCRGLWIIHRKGPKAALPEAQIRATLRDLAYRDHKIAGVSSQWTATRYARAEASA